MIYELPKHLDAFKERCRFLISKGGKIDLKAVRTNRSTQQNAALHKFFIIISEELNNMGMEFNFTGVKGYDLSTRYTPEIVKNFFWRPIQITLFDIESTRKINTKQINEINDVIIKFFGERGVPLDFPSIENL